MSEFEIRIPARKKRPVTDEERTVIRVSPEAYNALVEIYNESTISMKDIASLLIIEGSKHVVYDKEE
nr:MAG TPA: HicB family [Caudoviricetes sp.]